MLRALLAVVLASVISLVHANEHEVYLANEAGGWIVLTHEQCQAKEATVKDYFPFRAYSTESNGTLHECCYDIPSIEDAPKQQGMRIIPIVNFIELEGMTIHTFHAEWFTPVGPDSI